MHHGCRYRENDYDGLLSRPKAKPTMAGVGEDDHLRCCECKRKVVARDGQTHETEPRGMARVEPPYPSGWCTYPPEWYEEQKEVLKDVA